VFEAKVQGQEVTGAGRNLFDEGIHKLYSVCYQGDQITEDKRAGHVVRMG
jgi:hypothetical protein